MTEDVLKAIEGGSTLGEELTKINKLIQNKTEYKKLYNQTYGTGSGIQSTYNIGGTEYVLYNDQLITAEDFNKKYWGKGQAKAYNQVDAWAFNTSLMSTVWGENYYDGNTLWMFLADGKYQNWKYIWECGKFVNDYLQFIGVTDAKNRYYDNDLSTKLNSVNSYTPTVWSIAVFDYNFKSSDWVNHGHVGIVTKVNDDWSFEVRDSNFWSDGKIQIRTIKPNDGALKWFFDPSQASTASTKSNLSAIDEAKKQNYLEEAKRWKLWVNDTKAIWDIAATQWWDNEWREALNQWLKIQLTDAQQKRIYKADDTFSTDALVKEFQDAAVQIDSLITSLNANSWAWDLAAIFQFMKVLDPRSVVRWEEFENAAGAAWYANPKALYQKYVQHGWDWTWLTEAAKGNFSQLAKELIKWRAKFYQVKYDDLVRSYRNAWIDDESIKEMIPTNMADYILSQLWQTTNSWSLDIWLDNAVNNIQSFRIN